jgi:phosphohistidine phosphatase
MRIFAYFIYNKKELQLMKTLYLARHAKSSWKYPDLMDIDRPLNKRGKKDAPFMGKELNKKGITIDLIVTSSAERARCTAETIAKEIGYKKKNIVVDEELYEYSTSSFMEFIKQIDNKFESVMIFGHNPVLTSLNNELTDKHIENIPTCGIVSIQFDSQWNEIEPNSGKTQFFIYPKMYLNKSYS